MSSPWTGASDSSEGSGAARSVVTPTYWRRLRLETAWVQDAYSGPGRSRFRAPGGGYLSRRGGRRWPRPSAIMVVTSMLRLTPSCLARSTKRA